MAGLLRQYGAVKAPKRGRQFIVHRKRPSRGTVGVATSEGAMFGVLFGVAAGILILNMGVLWLGYLASEQRRSRSANPTILSASSASDELPPR